MVEIVGNSLAGNGRNLPRSEQHYSSLKGLDFLKGKLNSPEGARFAARWQSKIECSENVGAELAKLERVLDAGEPVDRLDAYDWIGETAFGGDCPDSIRQWALRLADKLVDGMTPAEHSEWRERYGCGEAA